MAANQAHLLCQAAGASNRLRPAALLPLLGAYAHWQANTATLRES